MSKEIVLSNGFVAKVDDADYDDFARYCWTYQRSGHTGYAYRVKTVCRVRTKIYMHRAVLDAPVGLEVDHINGDGLDNRTENLRIVSHAENQQNRMSVFQRIAEGLFHPE